MGAPVELVPLTLPVPVAPATPAGFVEPAALPPLVGVGAGTRPTDWVVVPAAGAPEAPAAGFVPAAGVAVVKLTWGTV